jgi:photosystem II stability/assembly factor-like uncharacterized protein
MKSNITESAARWQAISTRRGFEIAILLVTFLLKKSDKEKVLPSQPLRLPHSGKTIFLFLAVSCFFIFHASAQIGSEFQTENLTTATFTTASFISEGEGWMADDAGRLWHTTNAGETWSSTVINKNFLKLDFTDALQGFGLTDEGAWKRLMEGQHGQP